jgi:hypothetical protein
MTTLWAELGNNNLVSRVLVGQDDPIVAKEWLDEFLGGQWVQVLNDGTPGKVASLGFTYDEELDAFIPPKPSEDAVLDEATYSWIVPEAEEE